MPSLDSFEKCDEVRVGKLAMNVACGLGGLVLLAALIPAVIIASPASGLGVPLGYCGLVVPLIAIHESLHGLAAVCWGGIRRTDLRFGVMWRAGAIYCNVLSPITISAYRRVTLLPLFVTGAITLAGLVLRPAIVTAVLASAALAACAGDLWVFAKLRRFRGALFAMDKIDEVGCDIFRMKAATTDAPTEPTNPLPAP